MTQRRDSVKRPAVVFAASLGVLALAATYSTLEAQSPSELWFDLDPGPHPVGFAAWYEFDDGREFFDVGSGENPGRPVRIFLWYPAEPEAADQDAMRWGEYLERSPPDRAGSWWSQYQSFLYERELDTSRRQFSPLSDPLHARLLATEVAARLDAAPATGPHPILLHSLGLGDFQQESTVLWEYLASHGYVVAVVPQVGPAASDSGLDFEASDLQVQVSDLAFALSQVERTGVVGEGADIGVIGHSSGGIAALMLAHREPRVRAIAGLDGSFSTADGATLLAEMNFPFSEITASILDTRAALKGLDRTAIESMVSADRFEIEIGGQAPPAIATHFDFQNWPLYAALTGVEDDRGAGARSIDTGRTFYLSAVRYTRRFFDYALRGDEEAGEILSGARALPDINPDWIETRHTPPRR